MAFSTARYAVPQASWTYLASAYLPSSVGAFLNISFAFCKYLNASFI